VSATQNVRPHAFEFEHRANDCWNQGRDEEAQKREPHLRITEKIPHALTSKKTVG
jgi:hypothetical protein